MNYAADSNGVEIVWRKTSGSDLLNKSYDAIAEFPDIHDLSERIQFAPDEGRIWLDSRRMFLLHSRAFGALRREMVDTCGIEQTRAIFERMGYVAGSLDAELAAKVRGEDGLFDAFAVGPQMHALLGITKSDCVRFDVDITKGKFYGEYIWRDSVEAHAHSRYFDVGPDPVCWMQIGYATGYTSAFFGQRIVYKEVECACQGHSHCRIIGKPFEEWSDAEDENIRIQPHLLPEGLVPSAQQAGSPESVSMATPSGEPGFVGASTGFQTAFRKLRKAAPTDATVLFLGESGVGKERFATRVHALSKRANKPFIAVNCAAIPENLIESELFGVEKGAFTGATTSRKGRFERADGGTLFLDEIGTLSLAAQGKLLRALQEGEIERVGDTTTRKVSVRLIAATNVDLVEAVRKGEFREDLYYRLNVLPIPIPPLRERRADIPLLIEHFFKLTCEKYDLHPSGFSQRAIHALFTYEWPGNIRELENVIERGIILADDGAPVDIPHLFASDEHFAGNLLSVHADGRIREINNKKAQDASPASVQETGDQLEILLESGASLDQIEHRLMDIAVEKANGNLSAAARTLGISRAQLAYRLKRAEKVD